MAGEGAERGAPRCRVGAMSKVELAGRPEPGYESMEQFSVSVEHVADMLRTIDFQPGEGEGGEGRGVPTLRGVGVGGGGRWAAARASGTPPHGSSSGPGAAGEEEDEEVALDGEEGSAGPEEERPEGEGGRRGRGLSLPPAVARPAGPGPACSLRAFSGPPRPRQEGAPLAPGPGTLSILFQ